ncbi:hypothetical protein XENTR_v10005294 [Xenopus tropicalis]|nr:hypothetical protein XENTR_v10005294 [Xenopus tropicalis]
MERNIAFLKKGQMELLQDLHQEILRLQKRCTGKGKVRLKVAIHMPIVAADIGPLERCFMLCNILCKVALLTLPVLSALLDLEALQIM